MAIIKRFRKNKINYQVKLRGNDGKWISRTFTTRKEALRFELERKQQCLSGHPVLQEASRLAMSDYFERWFTVVECQASAGWRSGQRQLWRDYAKPIVGAVKLDRLTPSHVAEVLNHMARKGLSEQSRLHAFNLLRKMMNDAVELFQLLPRNPVKRSLKPKVPQKEARHLDLDQTRILLSYVREREYGLAIWIQLFLGLRVGELQALTWGDLDLEKGICRIHRSYVRREKRMKDYPKGRRQHSHRIPGELLAFLREVKNHSPQGRFGSLSNDRCVVNDTRGERLSYEWYHRTLKRYCRELELPELGTHSLRHSTSELYLHHGATPYDLQALFAHSSLDVTERYVHNRGRSLDRVCNVIQLFESPEENGEQRCSPNVPR